MCPHNYRKTSAQETHTPAHTADSHSKSLENGLKCNWETQRFNTTAHHEYGYKWSSTYLINMFFLQSTHTAPGNNFWATTFSDHDFPRCVSLFRYSLHVISSVYVYSLEGCASIPNLSLWHLIAASLHCKWNLVIELAAVGAHHVTAGDLLQPGSVECKCVFIFHSARRLNRLMGHSTHSIFFICRRKLFSVCRDLILLPSSGYSFCSPHVMFHASINLSSISCPVSFTSEHIFFT